MTRRKDASDVIIPILLILIFSFCIIVVLSTNVGLRELEEIGATPGADVEASVPVKALRVDSGDDKMKRVPEPAYEPVEPIAEHVNAIEVEPEKTVEYFDVPLSEDLQDHIFELCESSGIEPTIIIAMIKTESNYDVDVIGDNGNSLGLMQIQPRWHRARMDELGCEDLLDPYQNVTVGIDLLAELIGYGQGLEWALMAYNGGHIYANGYAERGEISTYVVKVMSLSAGLDA